MHVVLLAHGSRRPEPAVRVRELTTAVAHQRPDDTIAFAFLDHRPPTLGAVLATLSSGTEVVVVPLLLTPAFHAVSDVPAVVHAQRGDLTLLTTPALGPSPALQRGLEQRLVETGAPLDEPGTAVLVVGVGSTDAAAQAQVAAVTVAWLTTPWRGTHAFATGEPGVAQAVHRLREDGATRVVLAPYMLFGGALLERATADAERAATEAGVELVVADVLGDARDVVALVSERVDRAAS